MTTKLIKLSIITFILFACAGGAFADSYSLRPEWKEYKSSHFIIHYHPDIPPSYIRQFTRTCERYYRSITERLGLRRFDYWSWDNRARIVIFDSKESYIQDKGRPSWSAASVFPNKKLISTYCFAEDFFDVLLPHELTHIILREFIGQKAKVPLWFEEGLACANEEGCLKYLSLAKKADDVEDSCTIKKHHRIARFKASSPIIFYSTAASRVIFLLEDYSKRHFTELCRALRDGKAFYQAMNKVYQIKDKQDLEDKSLSFLRNRR